MFMLIQTHMTAVEHKRGNSEDSDSIEKFRVSIVIFIIIIWSIYFILFIF